MKFQFSKLALRVSAPRVIQTLFFALTLAGAYAPAAINVTANRYDTNRLATNSNETILSQSNVNATQFGKLWSYSVDGVIFAQPLYVQNLNIKGVNHNVLFIATMNDVVYAYDADHSGAPLWVRDFRSGGATAAPSSWPVEVGNFIGVMSTPVIDTPSNSGSMFVVAQTLENASWVYRLHKLSLTTGADVVPSTVITANKSGITFDPHLHNQRPGLVLVNGNVVICFSARPADDRPFHGWVMSYSASTLAQQAVIVTTTSDDGAGIWGSGGAPPIDSAGNIYALTGNAFNSSTGYNGTTNFSESLLKIAVPTSGALNLVDWFTAYNWANLDVYDEDLSCNAPMLIPNTDLVAFGSKTADVYVAHTGSLGHLQNNNSQLAAFFHVGRPVTPQFNDGDRLLGLAYWVGPNGPTLFAWPAFDNLHSFSFNGSQFTETHSNSITGFGEPGMPISLSANGTQSGTGIVWATLYSGPGRGVGQPGELHAFNAEDVSVDLWNSLNNKTRDDVGSPAKFVIPVVTNGRVYMATSTGAVQVYGVLPSSSPTPRAVSINFTGNGTEMDATETAGVVPKANWNNAVANTGTALGLVDETGAPNGANLTYNADNPWTLPIADTPGNFRLMRGYLDTGNQNTSTITISNLPSSPAGYDIYVYTDGDNGGASRTGTYTISGPGITTTSLTATDPGNTNFNGTFSLANNSTGNYVKFSSVQGTSFTLQAIPTSSSDGTLRAAVNGIQIIPAANTSTFTISGQITLSSSGLSGVNVSLSNGSNTTTDSNGHYSFNNLPTGTYTVTPSLGGYSFTPQSRTFTNITASQTANFTASRVTQTARTVSITFVGTGTAMAASETAGVLPKTNWNNALGSSGSGQSLVDETGATSGAVVSYTSDNTWGLPITDTAGNFRMMRGYLDTGFGNTSTINVSGLAPSSTGYDIYVYTDGDNGGASRTGTYTISGPGITTTSLTATDPGNTNFNGTFSLANNSTGNYVKFSSIQATSFTLQAIPTSSSDGTLRAPVNGVQIVPASSTATYTIAGQVTLSGSGLSGVTVSLSGGATTTTDSSGRYSFGGLSSGTYTVTPSLSGYTFNPQSSTFTNITANQTANFTASSVTQAVRTISINFVGGGTAMAPAESAGVVPKANWNNATNNSSSGVTLIDETGASTAATVSYTSDNTWTLPITDSAGNVRMMRGYLDTGSKNTTTINVSGLAASPTGYDIYVYTDGDNGSATRSGTYTISGSGLSTTSITATDNANTNFNGTFSLANNGPGNYVKFTAVKATAFTLQAVPGSSADGAQRAPVNGIQIVPSPQSGAAAAISINFVGSGSPMAASESAGVVPKTNWTNAPNNTGNVGLQDETGATTGATVSYTSDNPWALPITDSPGDFRMVRGYLDTGNQNTSTINVSGLPTSSTGYDVYVYVDGDNGSASRTGTYTISGSGITSTTITATDSPNTDFNGTFTQANNSAGNYIKITSINATAFTLQAIPTSSSDGVLRAPVDGIQIIPH